MTLLISEQAVPTLGGAFGVIQIDRPAVLNSVDLELTLGIHRQLELWQHNPEIAFVVIASPHERAFCAGGDIVALYHSLQASKHTQDAEHYVYQFFHAEYRLDHLLYHYPKPVVVLGQGIVMGGGVGMFMGASHRVAFSNTRFAMPEVAIGLFPDVAGTWMLGRLPAGIGEFLALSGMSISGVDCCALGLADWYLPQQPTESILRALAQYELADNDVSSWLSTFFSMQQQAWALDDSAVMQHYTALRSLAYPRDVTAFMQALEALSAQYPDTIIASGYNHALRASPLSQAITLELLVRNRIRSVDQTLENDLWVAVQCCGVGDLAEGVRALLIDKDKKPQWRDIGAYSKADLAVYCDINWPRSDMGLGVL